MIKLTIATICCIVFPTIFLSCKKRVTEADTELKLTAIYTPEEASGFRIEKLDSGASTLLTVRGPWHGGEDFESQLLILRNGEKGPEGYTGATVNGTAKRIVAMSSTYVAMLEELDALDNLAGVSGLRYITSKGIDASKVVDVGNEADADFEKIVALEPDLVLIYGVDSPSAMQSRLNALRIPYLYIGDYVEQSPLGRAEWIVALGEIVGKRDEATQIFTHVRNRYNNIKESAKQNENKPAVMVNGPFGDIWYMPSDENYMVRLISDAGGEYVYESNHSGPSTGIGDEEALMLTDRADIWLCPGDFRTLDELKRSLPKYSDTKPVKNNKVYNNNKRKTIAGGNDFFESGAIHPDRILEDLTEIFSPTDYDFDSYYFIRL